MDFEEDTYSRIFSALKHPVRRKILAILGKVPCTYTQLLNSLGVETGFLNYHLENLSGLVTKNQDGEYFLSEFGNAALTLSTGVEAPLKRRSRSISILGLKIGSIHIALALIIVLIFSNIYWAYAYQEQYQERTNALGEILIQNRGFLGNSISILNGTLEKGRIEFDALYVLYSHLIQLSRQYKVIISLDGNHGKQWSQIKYGVDTLMEFAGDLVQKILSSRLDKSSSYMNVSYGQSLYLEKVRDELQDIEEHSIPAKIVLGSSPSVVIEDGEITKAVEASVKLQQDVDSLRGAFELGKRYAITWEGNLPTP